MTTQHVAPISAPSVLLISGPTGSGKTCLIGTAAKWLWQRHKKVLRLYTADGGGYGTLIGALVRLGIIEVFRMRTRASTGAEGLVEETLHLASQGWWPESFTNPEKGEVEPAVRMIPPIVKTYRMSCPNDHLLKETTDHREIRPIKCPKCQQMVDKRTAKIETAAAVAAHMTGVGGVALEGLTSWSSWHLQSLSDRRARQELHGEASNIGSFRSGDILLDGNNRADYGFVQQAAERWLQAATTIQGLVIPPIFTALETPAEETGVGSIWGPSIAGQAKTAQVPQWVGDYLGTQRVTNEQGKEEFRLYLQPWRSSDGRVHPYKTRAEIETEFLADAPKAKHFSTFNLGLYFDTIAQAEKDLAQEVTKELNLDGPVKVREKPEEKPVEKVEEKKAQPSAQPARPAVARPAQATPGARRPATRPVGRSPVAVRRGPTQK